MKLPCIIVDMDGTLSDCSHRVHHAREKNWDAFHETIALDPPVPHVLMAVRQFAILYEVIISTGRPEQYRGITHHWLVDNGLRYTRLYMRSTGDWRPAAELKRDHLRIIRETYDPWLVLEDTSSLVKMFREEGLTVFQVAEEAFA